MVIPFNKPFASGKEFIYIQDAINRAHIAGDGLYTKKCNKWLEEKIGCSKALLTHSCTAALEMAAILANIQPGDEIIMPSYTFVSTANAFVLRGGVPVFVDIQLETLNIDVTKIEQAITDKTKAIVPVHYAGVSCDMDEIMRIANQYGLLVIEDAAQGFGSYYKGKPLGSIGHMAALSFHETKNVISGEGGALLVNDITFSERAEIIREKGTNRSRFFRGEIDKYTWVDIGSSYLPSEIIAAFLWSQLEIASDLNAKRMAIWKQYQEGFQKLHEKHIVRCPSIPHECEHNAHLFYLIFSDEDSKTEMLSFLKKAGIYAVFHYIPLHNSPAGLKYGKISGQLDITENIRKCLIRLPLWIGMEDKDVQLIIHTIYDGVELYYKKIINGVSL